MRQLPGITGTLFPGRYLVDRLEQDAAALPEDAQRRRRHLVGWWAGVSATCGPATGLRALFDLAAMPLFGTLGFRARDATFDRDRARVVLETRGGAFVGLVLLPWATRRSALWRDLAATARDAGASWCFLLAPPFLSLVDARGHATRRSAEFTLPDAFDPRSFASFWTLTHAKAFDRGPGLTSGPAAGIDALVALGARFEDRVREDLQQGVGEALDAFGGALAVPSPARRFDEALTLVYRILFLLFAESRDLVPSHLPLYERAYAVSALCRDARDGLSAGSRPGLWEGLAAITRLSRLGCRTEDFIVRPFNGRLFARAAAPSLEARHPARRSGPQGTLRDRAMQHALVALGSRRGRAGREDISYADLGVEELGAVYERVLDLDPDTMATAGERRARSGPAGPSGQSRGGHSSRRKESGTFYTPRPLAEFVVRRTLSPLVAGRPADAILALRVVDPAMGSGAFLVAACRFLAAAYERALVDEGRVHATDIDEDHRANIRRLVAERCLAGVDRNPVAVQLARLSLWLTTLARGKPLGFLDHRLRVGNSLIGASAEDLTRIPGRMKHAGAPELPLFDVDHLAFAMRGVVRPLGQLRDRADDTVGDVRAKEAIWQQLSHERSPLHPWRLAATVWCARWFWPACREGPPSPAELRALLDAVLKSDRVLPAAHVSRRLTQARTAGDAQAFFHWPLEFGDVFYDESGRPHAHPGFDAVIGNPPWEVLRKDQTQLVRFIRGSGVFPSCDRGHVNLYQPFLDRSLSITKPGGRVGLVLPWGLATDDGATRLRRRLVNESALHTIVGLDNASGLFPIHRGLRFLVLVASPGKTTTEIRARFGVKDASELDALPGRDLTPEAGAYPLRLTPGQLTAVGGASMRIPDVRRPEDLAWLERVTALFPGLGSQAGWAAEFGRELNATEDRPNFGLVGLPVIEGKHLEPFQVHAEKASLRIARAAALELLSDGRFDRARLGYRDVSGVANARSLIAAIVPAGVVTTHTIFCLRSTLSSDALHFLCGLLNSYVLNAVVRMLMGGHLTTSLVESLPVPVWNSGGLAEHRIAQLSRHLSSRPASASAHALLQGEVASLYRIQPADFRRLLSGFPLVPEAERERAARAAEAKYDRRGSPLAHRS